MRIYLITFITYMYLIKKIEELLVIHFDTALLEIHDKFVYILST